MFALLRRERKSKESPSCSSQHQNAPLKKKEEKKNFFFGGGGRRKECCARNIDPTDTEHLSTRLALVGKIA